MQHMSESVFVALCTTVGTSKQVAFRRETIDMMEMVIKKITSIDKVITMVSGSHREGFRFKGSDRDTMFWPNNHRVIMDKAQSEYYNTANTTLILSDSSESPPGFTLLQLLTPTTDRAVQSACVRMNDRVYIASSKYQNIKFQLMIPNSTQHGPCATSDIYGEEFDTVQCFASDFWPLAAFSWIKRCQSWPDPEVIDDLIKTGCHYVAIGHSLGLHFNEEWRISFSQAENKLVYSMNHSQFMTYGLLKLFLKEVIKQQSEETNKLLCSYHMKTTIFWAIQQNILSHWCPQNLLAGFWVCFKLLLKWVYEGICPNFFIPQNNMFLTKVHGPAQNRLFLELHDLYKKGLACLLLSPSIRSHIIGVIYNPKLFIYTDEIFMEDEVENDGQLFLEITVNASIYVSELQQLIEYLSIAEQSVVLSLTQCEIVMLQKLTINIFLSIAFVLLNRDGNKNMYIADKISSHFMKLVAKFGCVSDILYIAMYYYKTFKYRETLSVLAIAKTKLAQPYLVHNGHTIRKYYIDAVGGQSWSKKMTQTLADNIKLVNTICYINELIPEQQSGLQNKWQLSYIPLFVMLHFLEFLCCRHIDTTLSQAALDELQVLVHHDQGMYVRDMCIDIAWEILGICQQITGNPQAALYSYQQSLAQYPFNKIQTATHMRIQDAVGAVTHHYT